MLNSNVRIMCSVICMCASLHMHGPLLFFGLVLNTVNIETPSVGIGSVETTSVGLLKVLLLGTLLFVLPFFIFIFSGMFIILTDFDIARIY